MIKMTVNRSNNDHIEFVPMFRCNAEFELDDEAEIYDALHMFLTAMVLDDYEKDNVVKTMHQFAEDMAWEYKIDLGDGNESEN